MAELRGEADRRSQDQDPRFCILHAVADPGRTGRVNVSPVDAGKRLRRRREAGAPPVTLAKRHRVGAVRNGPGRAMQPGIRVNAVREGALGDLAQPTYFQRLAPHPDQPGRVPFHRIEWAALLRGEGASTAFRGGAQARAQGTGDLRACGHGEATEQPSRQRYTSAQPGPGRGELIEHTRPLARSHYALRTYRQQQIALLVTKDRPSLSCEDGC